jgi:hypothetical protein
MNLISVRCQHCGAPLQVGETARFVTCQFCKAELSVERTDSAVFTQQLGEIHAHTTQMAGDLEVIRLQNDLEKLDREWLMERERYMVSGKDGSRHEPGTFGSLFAGAAAVAFGIFWFVMTSKQLGAPAFLPFIGIFVVGGGVVSAIVGLSKASALDEGRTRYERQRAMLMRQLAAAQNAGR